MDDDARTRLLDAAEALFYARGIQAVGMDEIRAGSGLSLKRVYGLYPGKDALVEAYLDRRDVRWRGRLAAAVEQAGDPDERILAVFDWLGSWFREPGFRGCAWINGHGELGTVSEAVARCTRAHKQAFAEYLAGLVAAAGRPAALGPQLLLLAEGAMVTAGIFRTPEPAAQAREAAAVLVGASTFAR
ncbi:TetR/AcrR family transcriptional regulator [Pseudonocardia ailaonensis]|uniref:TetR/AcrR family transcriptional regulator n=1 Tax=Pseudonocardia ailaonensis TaxID=367279 RepID=A0ABN2N7K0_9PSEU